MARSFAGNTDQASAGSQTNSAATWTWCFYARNPGHPSLGRAFDWANNGLSGFETTLNIWRFQRNWDSSSAQWRVAFADLGITIADWNFYAITYDGTSSTNDPVMYTCAVDGTPTSRTVTEDTAPAGAAVKTLAGTLMIGNNSSGTGFRQLTGDLAWISMYSAVLSGAELLEARANGYANVASIVYRWPITGTDSPEPDLADSAPLTLTGTAFAAGPDGVPPAGADSDNPPMGFSGRGAGW